MSLLLTVPYLFRIIISLFAILVFQKFAKSLGLAMLGGIIVLALWTGHSFSSLLGVTTDRVFSLDTLFLVVVIIGVIWLSSLMSAAGIMKDLVISLKSRLSKRSLLMALPAVVGLLPMPAGALFSAPLLDDADDARLLDQQQKTKINYWFRHVWEFWWPLYPGVLLAVDLAEMPIWKFVGLMFPLFFAAIAAGYICLLRNVPHEKPGASENGGPAFLPLILPTLTVIVVYGLLLIAAPGLGRFNKYLPMAIGIIGGILVIQLQRPAPAEVWRKVVFSRRALGLALIIILARVYGAFIESRLTDGIFLMEKVRGELNAFHIPPLALVMIIPFISGLTTGITIGYIGASFPVVLSFAPPGAAGLFSTIIIGYSCGFLGMMLSPIHVCLIVTNEYYKTSLFSSLTGLIRPVLLVLAGAGAYSLSWAWLG